MRILEAVSADLAIAAVTSGAAMAMLLPARPVRLARPSRAPPPGGPPDGSAGTGGPASVRVAVTLAVGLGLALVVGGPAGILLAALGAGAAWVAVGRLEPAAVRRRREQLASGLPHVVDLMASCLAVGLPPQAALGAVVGVVEEPMRGELGAVLERLRWGVDPVMAWQGLADHRELGALGRCLVRAAETGSSVAEAMQRLAADLREERRAEAQSAARAVGAQAAAPLGLCLLPAFVLVGVVPLVAGSIGLFLSR